MSNLTPKQEKFCNLYVELGNASEAYRGSYDTSANANSVNRMAKEMLDNPKISSRVQQIREELAKASQIGLKDLLEELEQARQAALGCESPQSSAAVAATMGKAKLLGLDKVIIDHQSSDRSMSPKCHADAVLDALKAKYDAK